jgi:type VI secretion system protein VasD
VTKLFLISIISLLIIGCSSTPQPTNVPFAVQFDLSVGKQINPYGGVNSHPIVLRLYQLRQPGVFSSADFLDIYLDDRKTLGASLIDVKYLEPIVPGENSLTLDVQRDTRYVGVFAEFADYKDAQSQALVRLDDNPDLQIISVQANGLVVGISMKIKPKKPWYKFF